MDIRKINLNFNKCCDEKMNRREDTVENCGATMEAIMSRDQRTTSHRVLDNRQRIQNNQDEIVGSCHKGRRKIFNFFEQTDERINVDVNSRIKIRGFIDCDSCRVTCSCDKRIKKSTTSIANRNTSNTRWLRLSSLLVTLLVISVQSAPMAMNYQKNRRLDSPPKWVNPCGLAAEDIEGDVDVVQLKDEQLLQQIVLQARTALDHAELFRDDYIKRTFKTDIADLESTWKGKHYDWLSGKKSIPKELGEKLPENYLNKLELRMLDATLLDAYEYMQRYAVGLEQIVWDQEDQRLDFLKQFKDTEYKLRTVLCELQVALMERGVPARPDITREAMSSEYRVMSASETYRNLRDWLIFRDYMNCLEYLMQVFEHLQRKLES